MEQETINIDGVIIYVNRKRVKNINVRINKELEVSVSANKRIPLKRIEEFLLSKREWLDKSLIRMGEHKTKKQKHSELEYVTGDTINLLGHRYILNVIHSKVNKVEIKGDFIDLCVKDIKDTENGAKKKKTLDKFILSLATEQFERSLDKMILQVNTKYKIPKPIMVIRKMKTRWGTCNKSRKKITINYELVKTPVECLDYVILHELMHFLVSGHNKQFYGLIEMFMPDWKIRKKMLKEDYVI